MAADLEESINPMGARAAVLDTNISLLKDELTELRKDIRKLRAQRE
jgi:hypothetical protein